MNWISVAIKGEAKSIYYGYEYKLHLQRETKTNREVNELNGNCIVACNTNITTIKFRRKYFALHRALNH